MQHESINEDLRAQAALYALGMMGPEEESAFREHLESGCAVCRREVASFDGTIGAMAELTAAAPPAALRTRVLGSLPPRPDSARSDRALEPQSDATPATDPTRGANEPGQVWKSWSADATSQAWLLLRGGEAAWQQTSYPGVAVRRLFVDRENDRVTMLVRMEAGSSYPPHRHGGSEECYVLEGDLDVGGTEMRAGDYQRVVGGARHDVQSTREGCLLFIVSSLHDEILA